MKHARNALAAVLGLLGLIFIVGNQGLPMRLIVGVIMLAAAVVIFWMGKMKAPQQMTHITQDIDVAGDAELEQLKCQNCGAPLDDNSVGLKEGAIFVECPYCNTSYQVEEAPKW